MHDAVIGLLINKIEFGLDIFMLDYKFNPQPNLFVKEIPQPYKPGYSPVV
jgi:hypothetical protein